MQCHVQAEMLVRSEYVQLLELIAEARNRSCMGAISMLERLLPLWEHACASAGYSLSMASHHTDQVSSS